MMFKTVTELAVCVWLSCSGYTNGEFYRFSKLHKILIFVL